MKYKTQYIKRNTGFFQLAITAAFQTAENDLVIILR